MTATFNGKGPCRRDQVKASEWRSPWIIRADPPCHPKCPEREAEGASAAQRRRGRDGGMSQPRPRTAAAPAAEGGREGSSRELPRPAPDLRLWASELWVTPFLLCLVTNFLAIYCSSPRKPIWSHGDGRHPWEFGQTPGGAIFSLHLLNPEGGLRLFLLEKPVSKGTK